MRNVRDSSDPSSLLATAKSPSHQTTAESLFAHGDELHGWPVPPSSQHFSRGDAPLSRPPLKAQMPAPPNQQHIPARATAWATTPLSTLTTPVAPAPSAGAQSSPPKLSLDSPSEAKMDRRPSRMSLFSLFTRPKVEKQRGHHERGLLALAEDVAPASDGAVEALPALPESRLSPSRTSGLGPRVMSPTTSRKPARRMPSWEPLSLSQVAAHAIRRAKLQVPTASARSVIRAHNNMKQDLAMFEAGEHPLDLLGIGTGSASTRKADRMRAKQQKQMTAPLSKLELAWKTFVLLSSGHLLQYSAEGSSDRLPEKILQLGTESAAFACDLIPGKHWVLQVSQKADEDGVVVIETQSQSFLSRLRSQNSASKRTCSTLLLVLDSAESMDGWLNSVRKEIEVLGGKKVRPTLVPSRKQHETITEDPAEADSIRPASSDTRPNHSSGQASVASTNGGSLDFPIHFTSEPKVGNTNRMTGGSDRTSRDHSRRDSTRPSSDAPSFATTVISQDQLQLNQLREGSRLSYMSSGTGSGTVATSRCSTPNPPSPPKEAELKFAELESPQLKTAPKSNQRIKASSPNPWRQSLQSIPSPRDNTFALMNGMVSPKAQRHSTYGGSFRTQQHSPPKPAFATPVQGRFLASPSPEPLEETPNEQGSSAPDMSSTPPTQTVPHQLRLPLEMSMSRPQSAAGGSPSRSSPSKPFMRQIPVRPSEQILPRRNSSLPPSDSSAPSTLPRSHSWIFSEKQQPPNQTQAQPLQTPKSTATPLRRPNSMQIRADPAPFLSSSRPMSITNNRSTSSLLPPTQQDSQDPPRPRTGVPSSIPRQRTPAPLNVRLNKHRSVPAITLLPPAPPPNMPLPPPPPPNIPLPALPTLPQSVAVMPVAAS